MSIRFLSLRSVFSCVYVFRYCTIWGDYIILLRVGHLKSIWIMKRIWVTSKTPAIDLVIYLKTLPAAYIVFWILLFGIPLMVSLLLIILNAISSLYVTRIHLEFEKDNRSLCCFHHYFLNILNSPKYVLPLVNFATITNSGFIVIREM